MGCLAWLVLGACATEFTGDAHFPGGAGGCVKHCEQRNMVMDSFVYMGEYSTACVCRPKLREASAAPAATAPEARRASGASAGANVAVISAMRARAASAGAAGGAVGASAAY
jgi:hypothetical protein